jgi:hypothetical protein
MIKPRSTSFLGAHRPAHTVRYLAKNLGVVTVSSPNNPRVFAEFNTNQTIDMTCAQCETHFCYLCGAWLNPDHPYQHYNDPKNKHCFQRLMDGAQGDENDVQFGGRRGAEQVAEFWEQEAMRIQLQLNEEDTL